MEPQCEVSIFAAVVQETGTICSTLTENQAFLDSMSIRNVAHREYLAVKSLITTNHTS